VAHKVPLFNVREQHLVADIFADMPPNERLSKSHPREVIGMTLALAGL
jgi:hypothetical protein